MREIGISLNISYSGVWSQIKKYAPDLLQKITTDRQADADLNLAITLHGELP